MKVPLHFLEFVGNCQLPHWWALCVAAAVVRANCCCLAQGDAIALSFPQQLLDSSLMTQQKLQPVLCRLRPVPFRSHLEHCRPHFCRCNFYLSQLSIRVTNNGVMCHPAVSPQQHSSILFLHPSPSNILCLLCPCFAHAISTIVVRAPSP